MTCLRFEPGPSAHETGALPKCYQDTGYIRTFLYGIYVTGSYAISAIVQFPRHLIGVVLLHVPDVLDVPHVPPPKCDFLINLDPYRTFSRFIKS
jgi:hypothetical protein